MEKYIGKFKKCKNVVVETVYDSSEIKYTRKYYLGVSTNYSDHSALFIEHIFSNKEGSISEYNLWREYDYISKEGFKALRILTNKQQ